jgi:hypothetical protein
MFDQNKERKQRNISSALMLTTVLGHIDCISCYAESLFLLDIAVDAFEVEVTVFHVGIVRQRTAVASTVGHKLLVDALNPFLAVCWVRKGNSRYSGSRIGHLLAHVRGSSGHVDRGVASCGIHTGFEIRREKGSVGVI